jgi:SAM-dependent methyltransferase
MKFIKKILLKAISKYRSYAVSFRIKKYLKKGMISWTPGYCEYKTLEIIKVINNVNLVKDFNNKIPKGFGLRLDERIVEYPWIFSHLSERKGMLLDAGSTFNFEYIVNHPVVSNKQLLIFTFYPETNNYSSKRISYIYGDLRNIPFKDGVFDEIVCQSTLEHIDMDNSIYGYQIDNSSSKMEKNYEYVKVVSELYRLLKPQGVLLITVPYGKYENHGFFQQFDRTMIDRLEIALPNGEIETDYFTYTLQGWKYSSMNDCNQSTSYNPHTGAGKGTDGAAHSRSVCCIKFIKGNN